MSRLVGRLLPVLVWLLCAADAGAQSFEGALGPQSPERDGRRYAAFAFEVEDTPALEVRLSSDDALWLFVLGPDGEIHLSANGMWTNEGGWTASLRVDDPARGRWIAVASAEYYDDTSSFSLTALGLVETPLDLAIAGADDHSVTAALDLAQGRRDEIAVASEEEAGSSAGPSDWAEAEPPEPIPRDGGPGGTETPGDEWAEAALPWPPPQASATAAFNRRRLLAERAGLATLGDVDDFLVDAMTAAGYRGSRYLSAPGGFALVTQLEQTGADGEPVAEDRRWSVQADADGEGWSIRRYLAALVSAPVGFFRVIAIVVSDRPFAAGAEAATMEDLREWSAAGFNTLPLGVRALPFDEAYATTVLIYEFEKTGDSARLILPGRSNAPGYLKHTTLSAYLD